MSLESAWITKDNKTNINWRAFLLSEKILETNYILWRKLLKYYKAAFFSPLHALNLLPHREDKAEDTFFSIFSIATQDNHTVISSHCTECIGAMKRRIKAVESKAVIHCNCYRYTVKNPKLPHTFPPSSYARPQLCLCVSVHMHVEGKGEIIQQLHYFGSGGCNDLNNNTPQTHINFGIPSSLSRYMLWVLKKQQH